MKVSASRLAPLLRSDTQGRLLAALYLDPESERTTTELAHIADTSVPNASREVQRLERAEYVTVRQSGRNRLIRANTRHPLFGHVAAIVRYAYGPLSIVPEALADVRGVEAAFIYGSWAARLAGEDGPDPADIDVIVVGDHVDFNDVIGAEDRARAALGRDVNIRVVGTAAWERAVDPFLANVRSRPVVSLPLARG